MARSFSSRERPSIGAQALYIWSAQIFWSCRLRIGSRYEMPFSVKMSLSFVNAAFTTSGVAVTVGQAFEPVRFTSGVCRTSYIGNQTALRGFLLCFVVSRL